MCFQNLHFCTVQTMMTSVWWLGWRPSTPKPLTSKPNIQHQDGRINPVREWLVSNPHVGVSLTGGFPPISHPKMIIFSRENQWLLGTTILGNPQCHEPWMANWKGKNNGKGHELWQYPKQCNHFFEQRSFTCDQQHVHQTRLVFPPWYESCPIQWSLRRP